MLAGFEHVHRGLVVEMVGGRDADDLGIGSGHIGQIGGPAAAELLAYRPRALRVEIVHEQQLGIGVRYILPGVLFAE